jgi:hypothetical protein
MLLIGLHALKDEVINRLLPSGLTVTATATSTLALAVSSGKTLTLTATDNFNLTIPATGTAALGTGTANYLAKWSDANTLTNSLIRDDGTTIGIGTAPSATNYVYIYNIFSSSSGRYGLRVDVRNTSTGSLTGALYVVRTTDVLANYNTGMQCGAEVFANTANARVGTAAIGLKGRVQINAQTGYTAELTGVAAAVAAESPFFYSSGGTEQVTNSTGVYIYNQGHANVTTTATGLYIESQSGAPTNYAIRTNAGQIILNLDLADDADFRLNGTTYALIETDASDDELYLCKNTSAKLSFHNVTPVVQQVLATGAGKTVDEVIAFLQLIGLCKQA